MMYRFTITNFDKWNPRKDLKRSSWFRLDNNFVQRLREIGLSWAEVCVFPALIATVSGRTSTQIDLDVNYFCKMSGCKKSIFVSAFEKLKSSGMVDGGPLPLRGRNEDVTLRTNERTNVCRGPPTRLPHHLR